MTRAKLSAVAVPGVVGKMPMRTTDDSRSSVATWLAGYFDARGTLVVKAERMRNGKRATGPVFEVVIRGNKWLISALHARFGGSTTNGSKSSFQWRGSTHTAAAFLRYVRPHLMLRGAEVDAAFDFYMTCGKRRGRLGVPEHERTARVLAERTVFQLRPGRKMIPETRRGEYSGALATIMFAADTARRVEG